MPDREEASATEVEAEDQPEEHKEAATAPKERSVDAEQHPDVS